jgi:hypothetical protein
VNLIKERIKFMYIFFLHLQIVRSSIIWRPYPETFYNFLSAISAYHHWSQFKSHSCRQVCVLFRVLQLPPPIKLTTMITEILLKVALNTIIWHKPTYQFVTGRIKFMYIFFLHLQIVRSSIIWRPYPETFYNFLSINSGENFYQM